MIRLGQVGMASNPSAWPLTRLDMAHNSRGMARRRHCVPRSQLNGVAGAVSATEDVYPK